MKTWLSVMLALQLVNLQLVFLLRCRSSSILPTKIDKFKTSNIQFKSITANRKYNAFVKSYKSKILNLQIEDANIDIFSKKNKIVQLEGKIRETVPFDIAKRFFDMNQPRISRYFKDNKIRLQRKFARCEQNQNSLQLQFFNCEVNDKWLVNLSNATIPEDVGRILSLGGDFGLPVNKFNNNIPVMKILKDFEHRLDEKIPDDTDSARLNLVNTIKHFFTDDNKVDSFDIKMKVQINRCKKFIKENGNLLITKADKGQTTVIIDRSDYEEKMATLLNDCTTYRKLKKDPFNSM